MQARGDCKDGRLELVPSERELCASPYARFSKEQPCLS
jgi:hypothetical protein